jgi:hypothetical protein
MVPASIALVAISMNKGKQSRIGIYQNRTGRKAWKHEASAAFSITGEEGTK